MLPSYKRGVLSAYPSMFGTLDGIDSRKKKNPLIFQRVFQLDGGAGTTDIGQVKTLCVDYKVDL